MKRKKWTPEEYRAWRAAREARQRELHGHIERIEAELAAKRKQARVGRRLAPQPHEGWLPEWTAPPIPLLNGVPAVRG